MCREGNWLEDRIQLAHFKEQFNKKLCQGSLQVIEKKERMEKALNSICATPYTVLQSQQELKASDYSNVFLQENICVGIASRKDSDYMGVSVCLDNELCTLGYLAVGGKLLKSCSRNVFILERTTPGTGPILYGEKVQLRLSEPLAESKHWLLKCSKNPLSETMQNSRELTVYFGQGQDSDSAWEICYPNIDERYDREGTPIIAIAPFILRHVATRKPLAIAKEADVYTDFGKESRITCQQVTSTTGRFNFCQAHQSGKWNGETDFKQEGSSNLFEWVFAEGFEE